jgi:hypothetical protein
LGQASPLDPLSPWDGNHDSDMTDVQTRPPQPPAAEPPQVTQLRSYLENALDALNAMTKHSADRERESTERRLQPAKDYLAAARALLDS